MIIIYNDMYLYIKPVTIFYCYLKLKLIFKFWFLYRQHAYANLY